MITERNLEVDIEVDGGVTPDNVATLVRAGADIFVAGSAVFHTPDYKKTITDFQGKDGGHLKKINAQGSFIGR